VPRGPGIALRDPRLASAWRAAAVISIVGAPDRELVAVAQYVSFGDHEAGYFDGPFAWIVAKRPSRPPLPPDARAALQAKGQQRHEGFVEALGRRLQKGRVF
jgi:hypothetical protein